MKARFSLLAVIVCGCGGDPAPPAAEPEPGAAAKAIEELKEQYEELTREPLEDPVKWAADDIENIGDWDYRAIEIDTLEPAELEARLNDLGNDRWEVFWIEKRPDGYLVLLKKPSLSYLSKIPLSQLGRLIVPGPGEGQ